MAMVKGWIKAKRYFWESWNLNRKLLKQTKLLDVSDYKKLLITMKEAFIWSITYIVVTVIPFNQGKQTEIIIVVDWKNIYLTATFP